MTRAELNGGDEMLDVGVSSGPAEVAITANGMTARDTYPQFWSSSMHQNLPIKRAAVDKILGPGKPLSSMTREVGMAAVAAELHLGIDDLELDAADDVEKGAAALFLAGFGPKRVASIARGRTAKSSGRNTGRSASVRRFGRFHTAKGTKPAK